jgi:lactoylglutathione lyase
MRFGYTFIWVDNVPEAVDWFERALGLTRRFLRSNGPMGDYAELESGGTTLAFADTREARALFPGGFHALDDGTPALFQISFISEQVVADYSRALEAGARSLAEPHDEPWGQTISRIRTPQGVVVSIVSQPPAM